MGTFTKVADASQLAPGKAFSVEVAGKTIALFNVGGKLFAIGDECTHAGGPLCEGDVEGTIVTCPWHGATFDLETGKPTGPPASSPVPRFEVRVQGNEVQVEL